MRISDWSSDVCSSDLVVQGALGDPAHRRAHMRTDAAVATGAEASFREIAALDQGRPDQAVEQARQEQARQEQESQRSEEHTSELQSLMRISYAVFCLKKKTKNT